MCPEGRTIAIGIDTSAAPTVQGFSSPKGLVNFIPNAELQRLEDDRKIADQPQPEALTKLAQHIQVIYQRNKRGKYAVEQKMLANLRRLAGKYEPDKEAAITAMKMPVFFMRLSEEKSYDAEAQLNNLFSSMERFAEVEPTPIPDIPEPIQDAIRQQVVQGVFQEVSSMALQTGTVPDPEMVIQQLQGREDEITEQVRQAAQQKAAERAANMAQKIEDQLTEMDFRALLKQITKDIPRSLSAIAKGPVFRKVKDLAFEIDQATGEFKAVVTEKVKPFVVRVNQLDWYPDPTASTFDDGDNIEIEHFSRGALTDLIDSPGYKAEAIEKVLRDYPGGYRINQDIETERLILEKQTYTTVPGEVEGFDALNLWGRVAGEILLDWGFPKEQIPDKRKSYYVNAKMIGIHVIKAVLNPDPLGRQPYQGTSFRKKNDSQWGECVPDIAEAIEDGANAALRPLLKNMAMAASPITEVNHRKIDHSRGETGEIWAGKVFHMYDNDADGRPAVRVYNVPINAEPLMAIYEKFKREADDKIVPSFGHGDAQVGGAGNTASGLSMLRTDAARNLQLCFENIYDDIIVPIVKKLFTFNMMFLDDPSIKGDLQVKVRNVSQIMAKEQLSIRRRELLPMTNNPVDLGIMGQAGRAAQLEDAFKAVEMDVDELIPQRDAIKKQGKAQAAPMGGAPTMMPGQPPVPGGPMQKTVQVDAAGNPVAGQDTALFEEGKQ